ncbi:MAG: hypothetical protein E7381_02780 [Clostridiales bacterium]|nr:hypothetical protein [Clostridiales bacterium]
MKSFKDYQTPTEEEKATPFTAEELTKKIASAYNGKSNMEMMKSILSEAEKSKRAGTLSNAELENFYQTFSPMIDGAQRKKLRSIIDKLKSI